MLHELRKPLKTLKMLGDALFLCVAFTAAWHLREHRAGLPVLAMFEDLSSGGQLGAFRDCAWLLAVIVPTWIWLLWREGAYNSLRSKSYSDVLWEIFDANLYGCLGLTVFIFLAKPNHPGRLFFILFFFASFFILALWRTAMLYYAHRAWSRGVNIRNVLIIGSGRRARKLAQMLRVATHLGYRVTGFVDEPSLKGQTVDDLGTVVGSFDDLAGILDKSVVDEVFFVLPMKMFYLLEDIVFVCERTGHQVSFAADFLDTTVARPVLGDLGGLPMVSFKSTPSAEWPLMIKRGIDLIASAGALAVLSPLMLLIAAAIKVTSPGPVLFRQERSTLNGRVFTMYKFRTMVVDAEQRLAALKEKNEMGGPVFKMTNDPRITPLGRFLRRTSLDELPQFINVLTGEMSLVGPRPPLPSEVARYERWQRRRLSMRPGLTCIWQVNGRNNIDFERWMEMDLEYIDQWSLRLDIKLLLKTIPALLHGK